MKSRTQGGGAVMNRHDSNKMGDRKMVMEKGGTIYNLYMLAWPDLMDEELRVFLDNKGHLPDEGMKRFCGEAGELSDCFDYFCHR